jgi:hypothetical protein
LLHALVVTAFDIVLDRFDVFASLGSRQAAEVMMGICGAVESLADKVAAVSIAKVHKVSRQILVRGGFIFYLAKLFSVRKKGFALGFSSPEDCKIGKTSARINLTK